VSSYEVKSTIIANNHATDTQAQNKLYIHSVSTAPPVMNYKLDIIVKFSSSDNRILTVYIIFIFYEIIIDLDNYELVPMAMITDCGNSCVKY